MKEILEQVKGKKTVRVRTHTSGYIRVSIEALKELLLYLDMTKSTWKIVVDTETIPNEAWIDFKK